jgi:glycosyltransferase involved in cell wall biosynthesis
MQTEWRHTGSPVLSLVMPCYNEQSILKYTIPRILESFEKAGYTIELIAVDNGSRDRTGEIIQDFSRTNPAVVYHRVEKNRGFGFGVLAGISRATAPWVGMIAADGQVDAEDVVRLFEAAITCDIPVLGKVRRRFRMDGFRRKIISISYNSFVRAMWPKLESIDINGNPRLLPRDALCAMNLKSHDWFLDPEMMIKAHYMGLRVLELNVFARMRGAGLSHVRASTCWEFFRNLLSYRFSSDWKREIGRYSADLPAPPRVLEQVKGAS